MKDADFRRLVASLSALNEAQSRQVHEVLEAKERGRAGLASIEAAQSACCGHCGSAEVVRNGTRRGLQRWLCRGCGRSSNAATGTPVSRLRHKELFAAYAECMNRGLTLRESARALGISLDRAFRWRHRFLANAVAHQPHAVRGLLEVDETYFRYSEKGARATSREPRKRGGGRGKRAKAKGSKGADADGCALREWVPVLVARARGQPYTSDRVLPRFTGAEVAAALDSVVEPGETLVCTDGHAAFERLDAALGVTTTGFVASYHGAVRNTAFHVQSVNNYHARLKGWISRQLRGVPTKYLPHYLAWMRLLSWRSTGISADALIASALGRQAINL